MGKNERLIIDQNLCGHLDQQRSNIKIQQEQTDAAKAETRQFSPKRKLLLVTGSEVKF